MTTTAASLGKLCGACPNAVRPGDRRYLDHESCAAVLSTLSVLVKEKCPQLTAVVAYGSGGRICKPCYRETLKDKGRVV